MKTIKKNKSHLAFLLGIIIFVSGCSTPFRLKNSVMQHSKHEITNRGVNTSLQAKICLSNFEDVIDTFHTYTLQNLDHPNRTDLPIELISCFEQHLLISFLGRGAVFSDHNEYSMSIHEGIYSSGQGSKKNGALDVLKDNAADLVSLGVSTVESWEPCLQLNDSDIYVKTSNYFEVTHVLNTNGDIFFIYECSLFDYLSCYFRHDFSGMENKLLFQAIESDTVVFIKNHEVLGNLVKHEDLW